MTPEIKKRIGQIQHGTVPDGYKKTKAGVIPDRWSSCPIHACLNILNHERKPISEDERKAIPGPYPYYGPTQVQGYIATYESEGSAVLIGEDGDHFLKYKDREMTMYVDGRYTVNNHAHVLVGTDLCETKWFYYSYQHKSLFDAITRQGAGRYKLTKEALMKLPLQCPPLDEQRKIITILAIQDKIIELKQKLIAEKQRQKKYLMQQLLTGKKRLPGFSMEWKSIKIGGFIQEIDERTTCNNQFEILSVTKNGIVHQSAHFNKQIASEDNTGYKVLRNGNLAFSTMNLWMGSLDVLTICDVGIISPAYKVFEFNKNLITVDIAINYMKSAEMIWLYKTNSEQGASIVRRNLNLHALLSSRVSLPDIPEQVAIAQVLATADRELDLLCQDIELEKQKKTALMQLLLTGIVRVNV